MRPFCKITTTQPSPPLETIDSSNPTKRCRKRKESCSLGFLGQKTIRRACELFRKRPNEWESANHDIYKYLQEARIDTDAYTTSLYWEVLNHLRSLRRRDDPFYVALPTNLLPGTAITSNAEVNEYNELKRDITIAENELSARDRFAADIEDQLQHAGRAVGVGRGLAVLAFFALGSIVVPLLLLPLAQDQFTS